MFSTFKWLKARPKQRATTLACAGAFGSGKHTSHRDASFQAEPSRFSSRVLVCFAKPHGIAHTQTDVQTNARTHMLHAAFAQA
eukprot:7813715-Alexandrium_andersonii.AAC.1